MEGLSPTVQRAKKFSGLIDVLHGLDLVLGELALALICTLAHLALEESLRRGGKRKEKWSLRVERSASNCRDYA